MKKWKQLFLAVSMVAGVSVTALPSPNATAVNVFDQCAQNESRDTAVCKAQGTDDASNMIKTVINTMLFALGMIAVIMIVIGGIRYTTSNGDSSSLTTAKNTILYAVVGLIVAIMSYSIVNFVIGRF